SSAPILTPSDACSCAVCFISGCAEFCSTGPFESFSDSLASTTASRFSNCSIRSSNIRSRALNSGELSLVEDGFVPSPTPTCAYAFSVKPKKATAANNRAMFHFLLLVMFQPFQIDLPQRTQRSQSVQSL